MKIQATKAELKEAYDKDKKEGKDTFVFKGQKFDINFVPHVIHYLELHKLEQTEFIILPINPEHE